MRKLIFKNLFLSLLLIGSHASVTYANANFPTVKTEFTRTIKKNFNINGDGNVALSNKHGRINLTTWNKNEVKIDVTITVKTRNESSANDIFDRINVDFSNSRSSVSAETSISSQKSNWWGSNSKGDFRIDYEVSMPKGASLQLSNKYGDAEIDAIGGDAQVIVKYGNFNLRSVGGKAEIDLGYGNAIIGEMGNGNVVIKYSKLKVKKANQVNLESKYSKIFIDTADKLKTISKYDTYDIGELNELTNQGKYDHFKIEKVDYFKAFSKYTDFTIRDLYKEAECEMRYGGIKVENLKRDFEMVSFKCEYTDCKVYVEDGTNFQLDAVADHSSVRYPENMQVSLDVNENNKHEVKGHRGSKSGGKIKARLRYGGLKVR